MKTRELLLATLLLCSTAAFADSNGTVSFDKMKAFSGSWEGTVKTDLPSPEVASKIQVTLRVTSRGNALLHEMRMEGRPDDPITMVYLDDGRLLLTHYCDAGNRPRMLGKVSADGKSVEFAMFEISGSMENGHMHHVVFTAIDADHHTEDWTFQQGDQVVQAHFDLRRTQ
jgi:hypothetical protein